MLLLHGFMDAAGTWDLVGPGLAAGGLRVLRYGDTRAQVLGLEAVLGNGETVSHLGGLLKDNTGYALPALFCGSEGTLGVVTAVRLRLVPPAPERVVALLKVGRNRCVLVQPQRDRLRVLDGPREGDRSAHRSESVQLAYST